MRLIDSLSSSQRKELQRYMFDVFEKYRGYKYIELEREARITTNYEPRYHGQTNVTSDQTAQVAIYNVDEQAKRKAFCERIERIVDRLPQREKEVVRARYMVEDAQYLTDYNVYCFKLQEPVSAVTFAKIRQSGFFKIAAALGWRPGSTPMNQ